MTPEEADRGAFERTARTRGRRFPTRVTYDRETVESVLDEGIVCHLGFVHAGHPMVIPTLYARLGDDVYVHGSAASRALRIAGGELPVCLTVTLIDGLVLARTAFNHSINYRSVVVVGDATLVTDAGAKLEALRRFTDALVPGRWGDVRAPTPKELKATAVLRLPLAEVSAKVRGGPPGDEGADLEWRAWAGVIPLALSASAPVPDPKGDPDVPVPEYAARYARPPVGR